MRGNFSELASFLQKLQKLPEASQKIARALAPKVAALVEQTVVAQTSPTGEPWPATKSGAPAFGGATALGHVFSRLAGKSTVRTTVLYPLHFHQDGTMRVGRKGGAKIRRAIVGAATRLVSVGIKVPKKKKGESEFAFQQRLAAIMARNAARREAVKGVKNQVDFAIQQARAAGGFHDPPRPLIPAEDDPIPPKWEKTISATAREVMAPLGALPKGGV